MSAADKLYWQRDRQRRKLKSASKWLACDAQWATIYASVRLTLPPGFEVTEPDPRTDVCTPTSF